MKLFLHVALISTILVGSDYSVQNGAETRALLNGGKHNSLVAAIYWRAHEFRETVRRQVDRFLN